MLMLTVAVIVAVAAFLCLWAAVIPPVAKCISKSKKPS